MKNKTIPVSPTNAMKSILALRRFGDTLQDDEKVKYYLAASEITTDLFATLNQEPTKYKNPELITFWKIRRYPVTQPAIPLLVQCDKDDWQNYNALFEILIKEEWIKETAKSQENYHFFIDRGPVPRYFIWEKSVNAEYLAAILFHVQKHGLTETMSYKDIESVAKNTFGCPLSRTTISQGKARLSSLSRTKEFKEIKKLANGNA